MSKKLNLKIAVVQLNPQIGKAQQTEKRAWKILENLNTKQKRPDLIIFPEFALTGYNFHSKIQIHPYLEDVYGESKNSVSYNFASRVSRAFQCYTVLGYPSANYANSAMVVSPLGKVVHKYDKHFTYDTDDEWGCRAGPGFESFSLSFPAAERDPELAQSVRCSIGICMDLNPEKFDDSKFNDFDFASHCMDEKVQLIISPTAWLNSISVTDRTDERTRMENTAKIHSLVHQHKWLKDPDAAGSCEQTCIDMDPLKKIDKPGGTEETVNPKVPDYSTIDYWMLRFFPFMYSSSRKEWFAMIKKTRFLERSQKKSHLGVTAAKPWGFEGREAVLCICNRCGIEEDSTVFTGSSGIFKFNGQTVDDVNSETVGIGHRGVDVQGLLPMGQEGLLYREVEFEVD